MHFVTKKMMFTSKFVCFIQINFIYIQKSKETLNFLAFSISKINSFSR